MIHLQTNRTLVNHSPPSFEIVQEIINDLIKISTLNTKRTSIMDILPIAHFTKWKDTDVQSVSTMAQTLHTQKSDKLFDDACNSRISVDAKQQNNKSYQPCWFLSQNGYLISSSHDINSIKHYFKKVANQFNMLVARNLQNTITIKSKQQSEFRCLFLMCLPFFSTTTMYQFQKYSTKKGSKIKLTLIQGTENNFNTFCKYFYFQLWNNHLLKLSILDTLNLLYFINNKYLTQITKQYEQAYKQLQIKPQGKEQQIQKKQLILMKKFKQSQNNIIKQIFNQTNNISTYQNQVQIQKYIYNDIPIYEYYLKIQMQSNRQLLQRKKKILKTSTLNNIFQFLQINPIITTNCSCNFNKILSTIIHQNLPLSQAIYYLDQLNISIGPYDNIKGITNFQDKLIEYYSIGKEKPNIVMDMDCQLPLTIYCALISNNSQLKPIVSFLKDYFQSQEGYSNQNRTLAALKAALQYIRQQWKIDEELEK